MRCCWRGRDEPTGRAPRWKARSASGPTPSSGAQRGFSGLRRASSVAPSLVAQVRFLDELHHLPIRDEIALGVRRVREELAGYSQLVPSGSFCLLGDPRAVDPPSGNQTDRGLHLRAGAIAESLEYARAYLERLLRVDLAHLLLGPLPLG